MSHKPNNLTQPYIANKIGNYFDDPQNTNETARLFAHAALGAASAYISGNSAASGALGAASGEAIAILVRKELYGDKSSSELTQQEKETIRAVATLASGLVGAMSGGSFEDSATAAAAGYNAAVNNKLSEEQLKKRAEDIANCNGLARCELPTQIKWDMISDMQQMQSIGNGVVNIYNGLSDGIPQMWENSSTPAKAILVTAGGIVALPIAEYGYWYAVRNPNIIIYGITGAEVLNDMYNPSVPPSTPIGYIYNIYDNKEDIFNNINMIFNRIAK